MSELKTTQESHADNDISLAWDEYEKCGEVGNYAENLLHAAEFYQTESKVKDKENQRLTAIATKHATRADELYEALDGQIKVLKGYKELMIQPLSLNDDIKSLELILDKSRKEAEGKL